MKRALASLLVLGSAFALAFSVEVSLAKGTRIMPGEGIDRCERDQDCTVIATDPESCCPMCGLAVVTQARSAEIDRRCKKSPAPRRCRNHAAACGSPRPAHPYCRGQSCVDLNGGG